MQHKLFCQEWNVLQPCDSNVSTLNNWTTEDSCWVITASSCRDILYMFRHASCFSSVHIVLPQNWLVLHFFKQLWSGWKHTLYNYLNHSHAVHYFTGCINYMYVWEEYRVSDWWVLFWFNYVRWRWLQNNINRKVIFLGKVGNSALLWYSN